jgi:pimeloyl-ACP methyl ester carboxylesterase
MRAMAFNPSGNWDTKFRPGSFVNLGDTARRAVVSIGIAAALAACGSGSENSVPAVSAPPAPTETKARLDESSCPYKLDPEAASGGRCGWLVVLQDRSEPNGPTVRIPFAVFRGTGASSLAPVFWLNGGPGQTWSDMLASVRPGLARDNVYLEQRGNDATEPALRCQGASISPQSAVQLAQSYADCAKKLSASGIRLQGFTTDQMAADVDDLRRLLGYPKVVLNGISFGASWALATMRDFPESIEKAVLDSLVQQSSPWFSGNYIQLGARLAAFDRACIASGACAAGDPTVAQRLEAAYDMLSLAPRAVEAGRPERLDASETVLGFSALLSGSVAPSDAMVLLRSFEDWVKSAQSYSALDPVTRQATESSNDEDLEVGGQFAAVVCADTEPLAAGDVEAAVATTPRAFRDAARSELLLARAICNGWLPARPATAARRQSVSSAIPTLVLSGELDDRTPAANARDAVRTLSGATLVSFPLRGHSVQSQSACARGIVQRFITGKALDAGCAAGDVAESQLQ